MESEINARTQGKEKASIEELILIKWRGAEISTEDSTLLASFENLRSLSILNAGLVTLKNFPNLPQIKELELSDNKLTGNLEPILNCPELLKLSLAGNRISGFDALEPLKLLASLGSIDLLGNPITQIPRYADTMFEMFPELQILDGLNKDGEEDSLFSGFEDSSEEEEDSDKNLSDFIDDTDEVSMSAKRAESSDSPLKKNIT